MLQRLHAAYLVACLAVGLGLIGMGPPPAWPQNPSRGDGQSPAEVFSGTIEDIDRTLHKVIVKTDVGREVAFAVKKPELLEDLTKGERVTVQLDDQHTAIKIMKASIPELKHPPAESPQ
ncbi:MAG: hypothetical protein ACREJU_14025 [Nitrospiraceae bacterium]